MNTKYVLIGAVVVVAVGALSFLIGSQSSSTPAQVVPSGDSGTLGSTGGTSVSAKTTTGGGTATTPPKTSGATGTGRTLFTLVDNTAPFEAYPSIPATISDLSVYSGNTGWVSVLKGPQQFDLAVLHQKAIEQLFADVGLAPGTYTSLRLTISKVTLSQKNGLPTLQVYIPTQKLTFGIHLTVVKGQTSALILHECVSTSAPQL
jgi:hypothetical protein